MLTLYPELKPHKEHFLPVDNLHTIYIEESGNKDGLPVLFVHDGPGNRVQTKLLEKLLTRFSI